MQTKVSPHGQVWSGRKLKKYQEDGIRSRVMRFAWRTGSFFVAWSLTLMPAMSWAFPVQAAGSAQVRMMVGENKQITLKFSNTTGKTLVSGRGGAAVYLVGNSSVFGHASWVKDDMPAILDQARVAAGQVASATFWIHAPTVVGSYHEKFLLATGPGAWVKGSTVDLAIEVMGTKQAVVSTPSAVVTPAVTTPTSGLGNAEGWSASLVDQGGSEWQVDPGGHFIARIGFKNTGTKPWLRDSADFVSVYTGKDSRKSAFKDFSWKSEAQVVGLLEARVNPGEVGHFEMQLRAPAVPGNYQESFQLAAEHTSWIQGGTVNFPIRVTTPSEYIVKNTPNGTPTISLAQTGVYRANLLLKSAPKLSLLGNGRQQVTYGFKNTGTATWNVLALRLSGMMPALNDKNSSVRDDSWVSSIMPVQVQQQTTPGQLGLLTFTLKAPARKGNYTVSLRLYADNQQVDDGVIDIPITVTADGYIEPEPVVKPVSSPVVTSGSAPSSPSVPVVALGGDVSSLPNEPIIRVGLFRTTDDQMHVRAVRTGFSLQQDGGVVCQFSQGEVVAVVYDRVNRVYRVDGPRCTQQSSKYYVAVVDDGVSPLELTDFSRPVSWLPGANDNTFRSKLELRYTPATDGVWIINELLVESYIKGLAETSDVSPIEFQKSLLTAARTYAMYHVQRGTKHANEFYIVDAKYDQVYRGYGAEARSPKIVAGVDATRGQIVTYQDKLAITPYFSRSDGRTRSWSEVWGGSYAWLMTVPVPEDAGKTLWGHGVGMSASGALGMANNGSNYQEILKHFYTGIELKQIYK